MITFLIQGFNIVLYIDSKPVIIDNSHINYAGVKQAIIDQDWELVKKLSTVRKTFEHMSGGRVTIQEDSILFDGVVVHNALSKRMISLMREGFPIIHMAKFMERIDKNPSFRARNELYGFLEACSLPITEDGYFLAYKKIRDDWSDSHSGKIDNSIGSTPSMDRRDVNEDPTQTCSSGLHVCSYTYLANFHGQRIVAVKVDPADVVAVPVDYNNAKMRVCKYEVIEELAFEDAQVNDILSTREKVPAMKKTSGGSLEDIFSNFSAEQLEKIALQYGYTFTFNSGLILLDYLLLHYTYREIRENLKTI